MHHIITWTTFGFGTFFSTLVYYGVVIAKFYRHDLLNLLKIKGIQAVSAEPSLTNLQFRRNAPEGSLGALPSSKVHEFADELQVLLQQSLIQQSTKSEILSSIARLLLKHSFTIGSEVGNKLSNMIAAETEDVCNLTLTSEDIAALWK